MKSRDANSCRFRVRIVAATIACLAAGCGMRAAAPDPSDGVLAAVPCAPWHPSDADWSSLPTSRPAIMRTMSASPSGDYLYTVGTWFDAGIVRRQILRSRDLGETWCGLPTPEPVSQIAPSRANGGVLYALPCAQSATTARVLKTIDGGATWTAPTPASPDGFDDCSTGSSLLETSVTDPGTVWLNRYSSVHYVDTLYLSGDGGESWASVGDPPALVPPRDLPADPADYDQLPQAVVDGRLVDPRSSGAAGRLLAWGASGTLAAGLGPTRWFTSQDLGHTWREIGGPALPADPSRSAIVVTDVASSLYVSGGPAVFRSATWGETWAPVGRLPEPQARLTTLGSRHAGQLFAWPFEAGARDVDPTVWRSLDGGSTWSALAVPLDPAIDPVLAPDGADVIVGLGGLGISITTNGGRTWTPRQIIPAPGGLAQSPVDWRRIWADDSWVAGATWSARGTAFPGLRSIDGGLTWTTFGDLPGSPLLRDGASADVAYLSLYPGNGQPQRTEDGGRTWSPFSVPEGLIEAATTCPSPAECLYVLLSYATADVPCRLLRSDDHGRTWAKEQPLPSQLCYVDRLAVAPDARDHLIASCATTGGVCETTDGGQSWMVHAIGDGSERTLRSVLFMGGGVVLAAMSSAGTLENTAAGVVARSADGGGTWTQVFDEGGTLFASAAHPETAFLIGSSPYPGSVVFRSDDSGSTWRLASPADATPPANGDLGFTVTSIADAPDGGFVATSGYGLLHFK